jgi:hypothetical protein
MRQLGRNPGERGVASMGVAWLNSQPENVTVTRYRMFSLLRVNMPAPRFEVRVRCPSGAGVWGRSVRRAALFLFYGVDLVTVSAAWLRRQPPCFRCAAVIAAAAPHQDAPGYGAALAY